MTTNGPEIALAAPDVGEAELLLVAEVLRSGRLSMGPVIERFEAEFAARFGARFAVGVSSGTAALHLAMLAAGVGEGDLVVTTPFSFIASANPILYERAVPVFVDIDPRTLTMDAALAADAVDAIANRRSGWKRLLPPLAGPLRKLKAIVPVHVFGRMAEMAPILAVAQAEGIAVIEDACEAIGASADGVPAGRFGQAGVFGFYPNKQITCGEGGMILTDDEPWVHLFRSLRNQGRGEGDSWLQHERLGFNYRLDEMSAAVGLAQLRRLDELLRKRAEVAHGYSSRLAGVAGVETLAPPRPGTESSWFVYVVRLARDIDRAAVMAGLAAGGIPTRPYFAPIHLQSFYRSAFGFARGDFPHAEAAGDATLALPFHGDLSVAEIDRVVERLAAEVAAARGTVEGAGA